MAKVNVLVEVKRHQDTAFAAHVAAFNNPAEAIQQAEAIVQDLDGFGLDVQPDFPPVPLFSQTPQLGLVATDLAAFASPEPNPDRPAESVVVACTLDYANMRKLSERADVTVYPNSDLTLLEGCSHCAAAPFAAASVPADLEMDPEALFDLASSAGGIDCRPFRNAVTMGAIRALLGVRRIWQDGFRGQNVVVGIIDEGVDGTVYPVIGGFSRPNARRPGTASITSHGSMCAADVLVAAPWAKLYDYPFLGVPNSGGALQMFQAVLEQRRRDGTPQIVNNSYGFVGVPPAVDFPTHEIHDINHPLHRKVREVVASGCTVFFAAGNCGSECPSGVCHPSGIGAGRSIHASNSLAEVITIAAVNSAHDRIGYSSQGPGMFEPQKPDLACYSHFFGNFGPGRPAGGSTANFDNGTSAATPVAAGVAALLLSAFRQMTPARIREALVAGAIDIGQPGWDAETGFGVINAGASYQFLRSNS